MRGFISGFCLLLGTWIHGQKLVVGIVVDQMCYDYLQRFDDNFEKGGFNRFLKNGVNCKNTQYNYVPTYTGPGHASIYTGTTPSNHGIVANDWYDRKLHKTQYCVLDTNVTGVDQANKYGMSSPHFLTTTTISDQLKMTYPASKVISLSIKDRSAVLPGGHLSDGSYWFDFQSPYTQEEIGRGNYPQFVVTPFANTQLTDFATTAIVQEALGKRDATDLLCISYSTPDIAGHEFGPYSLEIEDIYLRLNQELEKLFKTLDREVGKKNYTVFLTADHAVVPVPQQLVDSKLPGGYLNVDSIVKALNSQWKTKYGEGLVEKTKNLNVYFKRDRIAALGLTLSELQHEAAQVLREHPLVRVAVCAHDLDEGKFQGTLEQMLANGYTKERSGDVLFLLKPGLISSSEDTDEAHRGTTHGSGYNYDTHVPLLWYGGRLKAQEIYRPIAITDIAATLVYLLELQRPASMSGNPIVELWEK
ncbi:MAG: alkaline phosphatase family protein [Flavobacteriia bacterium]|nr:alkaline phosphatase family protein [Flavobacteriia bacterium]